MFLMPMPAPIIKPPDISIVTPPSIVELVIFYGMIGSLFIAVLVSLYIFIITYRR